jgi:Vascular protein family Vasculin-like 1
VIRGVVQDQKKPMQNHVVCLMYFRLLREMGWKGNDDDDNYEITEADVKEFEKLCHQLKVCCDI